MAIVGICNLSLESHYQQLLKEFPNAHPEAVEASMEFLRIGANVHVRLEALFNEYSLSSGRFALLMLLRQEPSRQLQPSEFARRAQVSRATMTQFLDHLERDGLIKRVDDPNDRRSMSICLTPKAETVLKKVIPAHLKYLEGVTSVLTRAERKQLFALMSKLIRE
jgi:DNA-binding MarR family transcriptional regulator